jgi:hypothetical protein
VLAFDPLPAVLSSAERFERSRKLLESTVVALDRCMASRTEDRLQEFAVPLADRARKELASRRRPQSYAAAANYIALARQLWDARLNSCKSPVAALDKVMAHLSQ